MRKKNSSSLFSWQTSHQRSIVILEGAKENNVPMSSLLPFSDKSYTNTIIFFAPSLISSGAPRSSYIHGVSLYRLIWNFYQVTLGCTINWSSLPGDLRAGAWYVEHNSDDLTKLHHLSGSSRWGKSYNRCRHHHHRQRMTIMRWQSGEKLSEIERLYAIIEKFKKEVGFKILQCMAMPCNKGVGDKIYLKRILKICVGYK